MVGLRSIALKVVTIIVGLTLVWPGRVVAADPQAPVPDASGAANLRLAAGLKADAETISQSFADRATYSDVAYGVPLTPAEARVVAGRLDVSARVGDVLQVAAADASYAGAYLEGRDSPRLVIVATKPGAAFAARVTAAAPAGVEIEVREGGINRSEIERLSDQIATDMPSLAAAGIAVHSVGFDARIGKLIIGVDSDATEARAALRERYGDAVDAAVRPRPTLFACTVEDCGTRGGLGIEGKATAGGAYSHHCTSAFLARSSNVLLTARYMITAGHCITDNGGSSASGSAWRSEGNSVQWGRNIRHAFTNGTDSDSGIFSLGSSVPADQNTYFAGPTDIKQITTLIATSQQVAGRWFCRSGLSSGYDCGPILWINEWQIVPCPSNSSGCRVNEVVIIDVASRHGDSGAGFVQTYAAGSITGAAGILMGGETAGQSPTWYTTIQNAQSSLDVKVCLANGC